MKLIMTLGVCVLMLAACATETEAERYGKEYQQNKSLESLQRATAFIEVGADTTYVKSILGQPIDMGFDYRYLTDSLGESGSQIGAVFGIDQNGKVSWKDIFEIRE